MINKLAVRSIAILLGMLAGCAAEGSTGPPVYQGVVELEELRLGFEMGGRLAEVRVEEGDKVPAGAVVARLDSALDELARDARRAEVRAAQAQLELMREGARTTDLRALRAELRAARATETLAGRNLERQRRLSSAGASTASVVDQLESQVSQATARRQAIDQRLRAMTDGARSQELVAGEARVEAAQTALAASEERLVRHVLKSPRETFVLDVHAEVGEVVPPGAAIATVSDARRPFVDVFVPQGGLNGISVGAPARIRTDSLGADSLNGQVEHIARRTEFTPRFIFSERERPNLVIRVRVRVEDTRMVLRAGVPAFVTLGGDSTGGP